MEITVSARHMDVSSALRAAAEEKIGRLSRFRDGLLRADVHLTQEKNPRIVAREICEVSIEGTGPKLHSKAAAADPFAAIDLAVGKLVQQLEKLKTKTVLKGRQPSRRAAAAADDAVLADDFEEHEPLISTGLR
jgi:ribosomal subunit interface protein